MCNIFSTLIFYLLIVLVNKFDLIVLEFSPKKDTITKREFKDQIERKKKILNNKSIIKCERMNSGVYNK